jgi:hypothetical protein
MCESGGEYFDCHVALQSRVVSLVHLAHATGAYECNDFVRAEFVAYKERHGIS